jgi:hypothetical protein
VLTGSYDCADRIVLNAWYPNGEHGGRIPDLVAAHDRGRFARRVRTLASGRRSCSKHLRRDLTVFKRPTPPTTPAKPLPTCANSGGLFAAIRMRAEAFRPEVSSMQSNVFSITGYN